MISRLLFVRLKAAENALRDGRIDDAYRLATAPDIREHRRGAAVLAAVTERLLERARSHFRADRFAEATLDLNKAEAGNVLKEQIAELRAHVQTVAAETQRRDKSRRQRLDAAKRRIEEGSLAGGQRILEQASARDMDAEALRRAIDERAESVREIVEQAQRLMTQGHLAAAAQRVRKARALDAYNEGAMSAEARLCQTVLDNARAALLEGHVERAEAEVGALGSLGAGVPAKQGLIDVLSLVKRASGCIQCARYQEAKHVVMNLRRLLSDARWVEESLAQLQRLGDAVSALQAGPLGGQVTLRTPAAEGQRFGAGQIKAGVRMPSPASQDIGPPPISPDDTVALPAIGHAKGLPQRLLLLVDGGGSYLIIRSGQAAIGRAASNDPADVPIFSDIQERHANVTRVDEDYFLFSSKDVEVGGRRIRHHLLRDGDRLVLGRKAKMTFRLPSRRSPTAVLDLSDTTKMPQDVRRVVLFHQHALVGADAGAHIRCRHAGSPVVLFERNGSLWMRRKSDGHVDTEPVELALGEQVELGGVSVVLEPWEFRMIGQRGVS